MQPICTCDGRPTIAGFAMFDIDEPFKDYATGKWIMHQVKRPRAACKRCKLRIVQQSEDEEDDEENNDYPEGNEEEDAERFGESVLAEMVTD